MSVRHVLRVCSMVLLLGFVMPSMAFAEDDAAPEIWEFEWFDQTAMEDGLFFLPYGLHTIDDDLVVRIDMVGIDVSTGFADASPPRRHGRPPSGEAGPTGSTRSSQTRPPPSPGWASAACSASSRRWVSSWAFGDRVGCRLDQSSGSSNHGAASRIGVSPASCSGEEGTCATGSSPASHPAITSSRSPRRPCSRDAIVQQERIPKPRRPGVIATRCSPSRFPTKASRGSVR